MNRGLKGLLSLFLIACAIPAASAYTSQQLTSAQYLNTLGLFNGVGKNNDGTQNFNLDAKPTRDEAITMLIRLVGKEEDAKKAEVSIPFNDVEEWAKPYVSYAYNNGLTKGNSATTFGGEVRVDSAQYITFVLRALGYSDGSDFSYNTVWTFSDQLGLTKKEYSKNTTNFTRGDVALISYRSLKQNVNNGSTTLVKKLIDEGVVDEILMADVNLTKEAELEVYPTPTNLHISTVNGKTSLFWDSPDGKNYGYEVECRRAQDHYYRSFSWGTTNSQVFGTGESFHIDPNTNYYFRVRVSEVEGNESDNSLRTLYSPFSEPIFYDYTKTYQEKSNALTKADYELILSCIDKAANAEKAAADAAYQANQSSAWQYYTLATKNYLEEERKALAQVVEKLKNHPELEDLSTIIYPLYLITDQYSLVTPNASTYKKYTAEIVSMASGKIELYTEAINTLGNSYNLFDM